MEKLKKFLILFLMVYLPIIFLSCTKNKEKVPFFDGLFLKYDIGTRVRLIYNVHILDNNQFKIVETKKDKVLGDNVEEMYVDKHGKVYKSSFKPYNGKFSPIWIPTHEIKIGDVIFDGKYTATRKGQWKEWEVLVLKATMIKDEKYFDLNTGFWVGSPRIVLIKTNAEIPLEK